ncbi:sirohydrochlorin chelatase [Bacillus sp. BHET2]|uniref:sirohydrochlorin chelatase n=1 Tax=Bacillus sp. BHET2 TaxID=2583818 RepID=UPI00110E6E90|nr:sirohydrochlorin chelatase [Bacillus sp. BHET2]TMU87395.1 sirohydrochlorin chelatase [Bacillus sp. BHET2]
MKQAVLYVCHGSRIPKAREEAIAFIKRCQKHIETEIQEICFLELASPSIQDGFETCVKKGATHISVIPLLLLTAVHAKKDIPAEIHHCKEIYPSIKVRYGRPIGVHIKMVESVIKKIENVSSIDSTTVAVLIGRGSSDPQVKKDLEAIAKLVHHKTQLKEVKTCYLTAASPSFNKTLESFKKTESNVIFIPYLLFTGILMQEIDREIRSTNNHHIQLGDYLGYDPLVEKAFLERINETLC